MATSKDLKKILAKGLTGKEAGRLILQDLWDSDHGREGLLSETDIRAIKSGLKTTRDIEDYNRLIEIYRLVDFTLKEARILALEAENILLLALRSMDVYSLEDELRLIQLYDTPTIVTQRQYEDLCAMQKEIKLRENVPLVEILDERADQIDPAIGYESVEESDEEGYGYNATIYYLKNRYPGLWRQVVSEIIEVIKKAGNIRFIQIAGKRQARLKKIWLSLHNSPQDDPKKHKKKLEDYTEEKERLCQELYEAGDAINIIQSLEKLLAGSLSEDEEETLLEYTYCKAEDLYKAGIPEWIHYMDTYRPGWYEETRARPEGALEGMVVAIVQNPDLRWLDERGYWIDRDSLGDLSGYRRRRKVRSEEETADFLISAHNQISEKIKAFLAMQAVIEAVSKVTGVDFFEDMESWYESLETHIVMYNAKLNLTHKAGYLGMPDLDTLKIGRLKATAKSIRYYEDRMAIALGSDWKREALLALEFEPEDEDSLAQQMANTIKKLRSEEEA